MVSKDLNIYFKFQIWNITALTADKWADRMIKLH